MDHFIQVRIPMGNGREKDPNFSKNGGDESYYSYF